MNELQRHDAVEAELPRPKNHAHPAARNFGEQLIVAEGMEFYDQGRGGFDQDQRQVGRFQWRGIGR